MKKYFLGASLLILFSAHISEAAPAPRGIAINTETKECAGYWAGDEFVDYGMPDGWKAYYPTNDPENNLWDIIRTDAGECSFQIRKEEACCMELGYVFMSDNIGKGQKTILRDREAFEKAMQRRRNKTPNYWIIPIFLLAIAGSIVGIKYLKKRQNNLPHRDKKE